MKSHYLKLGDPLPAEIEARAKSLPPVQIQNSCVDEWELVDQVDDVSDQHANLLEHHSVSAARHFAENIRWHPTANLGDQGSFQFYLNHQLQQPDTSKLPTDLTLAHFIRNFAKLTGTKIGCGEGGCGACTVLLSYISPSDGRPVSVPVNSCLRPLLSCNGMSVTTIEGIGSAISGYHPIQTRLAQNAGTQCGYCSPGFGMNAFSLLVNSPKPTELQVENQFSGNICRCTGYRPILEAYRSFCKPRTADSQQSQVGSCGKSCATCTDNSCPSASASVDIEDLHPLPYALRQAGHTSWISCGSDGSFEQKWLHATIEELSKLKTIGPSKLIRFNSNSNWFQPSSLSDVYQLLTSFSNVPVRLVVGNTSTGVVKYYPHVPTDTPSVYVDISRISELNTVSVDSFGVQVGAAVSLQALIDKLLELVHDPKTPSKLTATFPALISHLERIGNVQVRSVGSWAGNFMTAKQHAEFPSDFVTMMSAYRSIIEWTSASRGKQCFDVLTSLKYQQSADEFVSKLHIPFSADGQLFDSYKIAARHQNSHAIVNASFNIFVDSKNRVTDGTIVVGGIKRGPLSCIQTVAILIGQVLSPLLLQHALPVLQAECTPDQHAAIGSFILESPSYRQSCATTLFYRYVLARWFPPASLPPRIQSATAAFDRPISSGIQVFSSNSAEAPVSYPIPKISGILQTSGEAQYSNDLPILPNTLFAAYSKSTQPSAKLVSIDASEALKLPGVISFLSARSIAEIGGVNSCGMV
jgi:xanthine dehydrogenase/oxidase